MISFVTLIFTSLHSGFHHGMTIKFLIK